MKTKQKLETAIKNTIIRYKEIIFGEDSSVYKTCLDKLRKQQLTDENVYYQQLMDDTVRKLA